MGKSGGKKKVGTQSGTEKKTSKVLHKEARRGEPFRQAGNEAFMGMLQGNDTLSQQIQNMFGEGGTAYSPESYQQAIQNAQTGLEPIHAEARRLYQQQTLPDIFERFGRGAGKTSSALNQAIGASTENLHSMISAQIAQMAMNERGRQQEMQYNTLQNAYGNRQQAASILSNTGLSQAQLAQAREQRAFVDKGQSNAIPLIAGGLKAAAHVGAAVATGGASIPVSVASESANLGKTNNL